MILGAIGQIGVDGGVGHVVEYAGRGDPRALDGGADDDLQHVDRGGRARGDDRARRDDLRLPRGPPSTRPQGADWERALDDWRALPTDAGAVFDRRSWSTSPTLVAAGHLGDEPGHGRARSTGVVPDPARVRRPGRPRRRRARARLHGPRAGHADRGHRASTASSSARARTRGSRTCAPPPRSSRGRTVARRRDGDGRPRLGAGEAPGRGGGARPASSSTPASSGGTPAARCASG